MSSAKLLRVECSCNSKYKPDGLKSYGRALLKYNITPTKDGPFFMGSQVHHQGKFKSLVGGKTTIHKMLMKKPANAAHDALDATPIEASDIQNDIEYLAPVAIGTPAQTLNLDFDTGSSDLWVWSTELASSVTSASTGHVIFNPSKSTTYQVSKGSTWSIGYGDGSTASGDVGTDNITLGGVTVTAQAIELAKTLSTQFQQSTGDGLLGLAWPVLNTVKPTPAATPTENMISQKDVAAPLFTAHLAASSDAGATSFYTFGFIDADTLSAAGVAEDAIHYAPIDNSNGFWQFPSATASVNGKSVSVGSSNTAIADTGTTLALVSDALVEAVYAAIPGAKYDSTQQGYLFPTSTSVDSLPTVQVAVGEQLFTINKSHLAFADAGNGMSYGGIQSRGSQTFDILGDVFLKGVYAIFDIGNKRLGVVQNLANTSTSTTTATKA